MKSVCNISDVQELAVLYLKACVHHFFLLASMYVNVTFSL